MEGQFKLSICPKCGLEIWYDSIYDHITCTKCGCNIFVEPKKDSVVETYNSITFEESICEKCKHHSHYWDEVDGELYDDGCYCNNSEALSPTDYHLRNCYIGVAGCPYFEPKGTEEII